MKQMDNRQLIIEKALELFCARGYDAVGVQEIAEQSGITKPTLYYYFGSKQGLMETNLEENSHILEEMLERRWKNLGMSRRCYTVWRERILILREATGSFICSC